MSLQEERWSGTRQDLIAEINKHFPIPDHPQHVLFRSIATYLVQHCTVFDPTFPNGCYIATSAHEHEIVKGVNVSPFVWLKDVQQHGSKWFTVLEQAAAPSAVGKPPRHYVCLRLKTFEDHCTVVRNIKLEPDLSRDAWSHSRPLLQATVDRLWPGNDDDARFIRRALKELVDKGLVQWPLGNGQYCFVPLPLKLVDVLSVSQILRSGVTRDAASVLLQQAGDYLMVGRLPGGNEKTLTLHMGRLQQSFLALEPLLAATTIPPPAVCVPQFTPAFSTIPAQLLTNVRASQPVRPPSFPTIDKPMSYLISTGPPASLVSATSPTMMIDNSTRFPSQPIKPLSSTQMHHHQQQYYAHPQPYTQLQVQPQPHKQNIPMDPSALADAVALLSHTHPPNVHIVAISQADSTRALPRQHTNNSATHRSNDSPGSSDGRRSRGSMPFGNALGNGASSSSSFTTSATMQVLCTEQPQPGVLCKGASEAGACVLSVLATKERVGVLLVSVPSDPPVCFSIPLEPMLSQCATILPPTWIHTELTLLLADDSVQKVLHNGRLVGGVLQLLHLSLGARVLDTKVLGMQLHAMYAACDTASPDGVVAAVMMDVEGALAHNGIQVAAPSAADLAALTVEQQHNPLQWAVCPAMPLQLLMAAQQDLATLLLAASLRQLVKALAAGAWAESCSLRYALGQRVILPVAEASTSPR